MQQDVARLLEAQRREVAAVQQLKDDLKTALDMRANLEKQLNKLHGMQDANKMQVCGGGGQPTRDDSFSERVE